MKIELSFLYDKNNCFIYEIKIIIRGKDKEYYQVQNITLVSYSWGKKADTKHIQSLFNLFYSFAKFHN